MSDKRVVPLSQHDVSHPDTATWLPVPEFTAAAQKGHKAWIVGEPSLQDLLADPLVHAVLRRDGLSLQDLRRAIALGRRRLAPAARHHSASDAA